MTNFSGSLYLLKVTMTIIACGINHKTAGVALREKVVFSADRLNLYLQDLLAHENIQEAVVLSTCNRSELYCVTDNPSSLLAWFSGQHNMTPDDLASAWYCYEEACAVEHIMRVTCGLDSMVLGEPQITGQVKEAFSEACAAGSIGTQFNRLFQHVFAVAKEIRTNTSIGGCPVSIASAAVNLAKTHFPNWHEANVLLLGAGETIQLVLRYLQNHNAKNITVCSRRLASDLANAFSAKAVDFSELNSALDQTDILISATGSPVPIITKKLLISRTRPITIIDMAVPRDIAPDTAELSSVHLFSIDDLKNVIQQNQQGREHAAQKASEIISRRSEDFMSWLKSLNQTAATICAYRKQIEDLLAIELKKSLRQLERGECAEKVLADFARVVTNKLLHNPSIQLRQAGASGKFELLKLAQQLLAV